MKYGHEIWCQKKKDVVIHHRNGGAGMQWVIEQRLRHGGVWRCWSWVCIVSCIKKLGLTLVEDEVDGRCRQPTWGI